MAAIAERENAPAVVEPEAPAPVSEVQPAEPEVPAVVEEPEVEPVAPLVQEPETPAEPEAPVVEPELDADGNPIEAPAVVEEEQPKSIDFEAAYKELFAPIKANGKEIEIRDIEEARRLLQMGAGFGRKMNELQPHLKTLRTLDKNGISAADLNYLIDLHQRKPDAIRKLVQDSGLDPLEMDVETPVNYQPTVHSVSDNEIRFQQELDTLKYSESGQETINVINREWDAPSVEYLLENAGAIARIDDQRKSGVYDQIMKEVDRQQALGKIPSGTSKIDAYMHVGNWMGENNMFAPAKTVEPTPVVTTPPQVQPLARRAAAPAPVQPNSKIAAAAPTKVAQPAKPSATGVSEVAKMSDEEFLKRFGNKY